MKLNSNKTSSVIREIQETHETGLFRGFLTDTAITLRNDIYLSTQGGLIYPTLLEEVRDVEI